jgi:hypothetical protein
MTIIWLLAAFVTKADDFSLVHRLNSGKVDIYLQNSNAFGAGVHSGTRGYSTNGSQWHQHLQRIERTVFVIEISDVWFNPQRRTSGAFDDFRGSEFAPVAIDIFTQPAM